MRDYLYIWHDIEHRFIVASGIEFKDFLPTLSKKGGVLLLQHQSDTDAFDAHSGFNFISKSALKELARENIYSWGNFVWADYFCDQLPHVPDEEISELLFFSHQSRPLRGVSIPTLNNDFLCYAHDDGWYLQLYYDRWQCVEDLLRKAVPRSIGDLNYSELATGQHAFWLQRGQTHYEEERTHALDTVLNRRLRNA